MRSARMFADNQPSLSQRTETHPAPEKTSFFSPVSSSPPTKAQAEQPGLRIVPHLASIEASSDMPRLRSQAERDLLACTQGGEIGVSFSLTRPRLLPLTCAAMARTASGEIRKPCTSSNSRAGRHRNLPKTHRNQKQKTRPVPALQIRCPSPPTLRRRLRLRPGHLIKKPMLLLHRSATRSAPCCSTCGHRREQLDEKSRLLDQRAAQITAADEKLNARVQQLTALQSQLEAFESARQQRQTANWGGLVKTYEAMKPRDAAAIFDSLDMQVLLQVLDRMQERRAAAVPRRDADPTARDWRHSCCPRCA